MIDFPALKASSWHLRSVCPTCQTRNGLFPVWESNWNPKDGITIGNIHQDIDMSQSPSEQILHLQNVHSLIHILIFIIVCPCHTNINGSCGFWSWVQLRGMATLTSQHEPLNITTLLSHPKPSFTNRSNQWKHQIHIYHISHNCKDFKLQRNWCDTFAHWCSFSASMMDCPGLGRSCQPSMQSMQLTPHWDARPC